MVEQLNVLEDYLISRRTMAMVPIAHMDYSTIVFEVNRILYVKKTCMEIIKPSCLQGGASYNGRREAAMEQIGGLQKVPIGIDTHDCIYAIPTHSPTRFNCIWVFYDHIQRIYSNADKPKKCSVVFNNGKELRLEVSLQTMQKQLYRTSLCMKLFSRR